MRIKPKPLSSSSIQLKYKSTSTSTLVGALPAQGTITISVVNPGESVNIGDSVTIGPTTLNFADPAINIRDIQWVPDPSDCITNLMNTIRANSGSLVKITGAMYTNLLNITTGGHIYLESLVKGISGNSIILTSNSTGISTDGSGFLGGTQLGVDGTPVVTTIVLKSKNLQNRRYKN
jgi:hypothetical protein